MPFTTCVARRRYIGLTFGRGALAGGLPGVAVIKDPNCGCCEKWVTHLREAGFTVTVTEGPVNPVKARLGVPRISPPATRPGRRLRRRGPCAGQCYQALLTEKTKGTGLAVPGMPAGSPGMEVVRA